MTGIPLYGVKKIVMHQIWAFTPTEEARSLNAQVLTALRTRLRAWRQAKKEDKRPDHNGVHALCLHERLVASGIVWNEVASGFSPTYTIGESVLTCGAGHFAIRVLHQGIGTVVKRREIENVAELLDHPTDDELIAQGTRIEKAVRTFFYDLNTEQRTSIQARDYKQVAKERLQQWLLDYRNEEEDKHISFGRQRPYPVLEVVLDDCNEVAALAAEAWSPDKRKAPSTPKTKNRTKKDKKTEPIGNPGALFLYGLARNYARQEAAKRSHLNQLEDAINDLALPALEEYCRGHPTSLADVALKNMSQTNRAFVGFGRRGAVVAYAHGHEHKQLTRSFLNMLGIVRGRFHNMIIIGRLLDDTLKVLSQLAQLDRVQRDDLRKQEGALAMMIEANYLYGRIVTDPGVYLLDGSTLGRLSEMADEYFHLRELRANIQRKMEALHRIWNDYKDQQRMHIISLVPTLPDPPAPTSPTP